MVDDLELPNLIQGHWKWYRSIYCVWFRISVL